MAPTIVTRAQWGARRPKSGIATTSWGNRVGVAVHHSAGAASSSVSAIRAIQNGDMDSDGFSDVGYNWMVTQDGRLWEGRSGGWLAIGAHAGGQNTGWIGVCWLGHSGNVAPSAAALATIRWVVDEARRRAGRTLQVRGHGQVPGQATECPGSRLRAWIAAGLPASGGSGGSGSSGDTSVPVPSGSPLLRVGSTGTGVRQLQNALNEAVDAGLKVDGDFGTATEAALKVFQRSAGLDDDGIYGPATAGALREELSEVPLTKDDVKTILKTDNVIKAPAGYGPENTHWTLESVVRSMHLYSRLGADRAAELLAGLAALRAQIGGGDQADAFRAELERHRGLQRVERQEDLAAFGQALGPVLAEELRTAAADLPAEAAEAVAGIVDGAVERALSRTSFTVAPAADVS